jgi:hypothetical protein
MAAPKEPKVPGGGADRRGAGLSPGGIGHAVPMAAPPISILPLEPPHAASEGQTGGPVGAQARLQILRQLRVGMQDLQAVLAKVRTGEATIKEYADYLNQAREDLAALLAELRDDEYIKHLKNLWAQMAGCPLLLHPEADIDAQQQMHHLNLLQGQMENFITTIGFLTIPTVVNDWLAVERPGYFIPFHFVFEDELPKVEDRNKLLQLMSFAPDLLRLGIIEPDNGLIYRYAHKAWNRFLSVLLLLLAFAGLTGAIVGACYLPIEDWPFQMANLHKLLPGWAAVLAGLVIHLSVGSVKRRQIQGGIPLIIAVGDFPKIINAKIGHILRKLFLALFGFAGLVFASGVEDITLISFLISCFLVGYSLDSFVEVFATSIEQQATAQAAGLKQKLGIATGA